MRKRLARPLATASAALIVAGSLAACGSDSSDSGESNRTFIYTYGTDGSQNYDPQQSANVYAFGYELPVFDTLLTYSKDGTLAPGLATEYAVSDAGDEITLTLRGGVTFHDGSDFNASAVKASFERGQTLETSTIKAFLAPITSIETPDEKTVVVTIKPGTAASVLGAFTDRAGMIVSPEAAKNADFNLHPVGTGPFEVSDESVPGKDMIYTKYDKYWDPSVQKIDTYDIRVVASPALKSTIEGKSLSLAVAPLPKPVADEIKASGVNVTYPSIGHLETLYLNKSGLFADERLRQAVSYAVDRTQLAAAIGNECPPDSQGIAPNSVYYDKDLPVVTRDVEHAKQLLAEAGKPDGFTFSVGVVADHPDGLNLLQVLQQQLAEVGITLELKPLPPTELLPAFLDGKVDSYKGTFPGAQDPNSFTTTLTSVYSPGGLTDPELTELAQEGAGETDVDARIDIFHNWQARYQDVAWHVGLCNSAVPVFNVDADGVRFIDPLGLDPRGLSLK